MVEQFQKVLETIIIPQFPEVSIVRVNQMGFGDFYNVRYYLNKQWDGPARPVDLMNETVALFKMMSPDKNSDIFIDMRHIDELEDNEDDED